MDVLFLHWEEDEKGGRKEGASIRPTLPLSHHRRRSRTPRSKWHVVCRSVPPSTADKSITETTWPNLGDLGRKAAKGAGSARALSSRPKFRRRRLEKMGGDLASFVRPSFGHSLVVASVKLTLHIESVVENQSRISICPDPLKLDEIF